MIYGKCPICESDLKPTWFTEKEYKTNHGIMIPTGRTKRACNYLYCENCGHKETVDDTFDGPWRD